MHKEDTFKHNAYVQNAIEEVMFLEILKSIIRYIDIRLKLNFVY